MSASQAGRRGFDPRLPLYGIIMTFYSSGVSLVFPNAPFNWTSMFQRILTTKFLLILLICIILSGCSFFQPNVTITKEASHLLHYKNGLRAFNKSELVQAEILFHDALESRKNFAPALEGLARVYFERKDLQQSELFLERAIYIDRNWIPAYILKGQIYKYKEDYDLALAEFQLAEKLLKAYKIPSLSRKLQPLLAEAYMFTGQFRKAADHYNEAIQQFPDQKDYQQALNEVNTYLHLLDGQSSDIRTIVTHNKINRADLAVLLSNYLVADSVCTEPDSHQPIDAPSDPLYRKAILRCLHSGCLPLLPDSTFRPGDFVDRTEMALFINRILLKKFPEIKATKGINFADLDSKLPYFRAARLVVDLDMIHVNEGQYFYPRHILSGGEAVRIVYRLARFLETPLFPANVLRDKSPDAEKDQIKEIK